VQNEELRMQKWTGVCNFKPLFLFFIQPRNARKGKNTRRCGGTLFAKEGRGLEQLTMYDLLYN